MRTREGYNRYGKIIDVIKGSRFLSQPQLQALFGYRDAYLYGWLDYLAGRNQRMLAAMLSRWFLSPATIYPQSRVLLHNWQGLPQADDVIGKHAEFLPKIRSLIDDLYEGRYSKETMLGVPFYPSALFDMLFQYYVTLTTWYHFTSHRRPFPKAYSTMARDLHIEFLVEDYYVSSSYWEGLLFLAQRLVEAFLPLVLNVLRASTNASSLNCIPADDLFATGTLGIYRGFFSFSLKLNGFKEGLSPFVHFLCSHIRNVMIDVKMSMGQTVSLPPHMSMSDQLADYRSVDIEQPTGSRDDSYNSYTIESNLTLQQHSDCEERLAVDDQVGFLRKVLAEMPPLTRQVLALKHGVLHLMEPDKEQLALGSAYQELMRVSVKNGTSKISRSRPNWSDGGKHEHL